MKLIDWYCMAIRFQTICPFAIEQFLRERMIYEIKKSIRRYEKQEKRSEKQSDSRHIGNDDFDVPA